MIKKIALLFIFLLIFFNVYAQKKKSIKPYADNRLYFHLVPMNYVVNFIKLDSSTRDDESTDFVSSSVSALEVSYEKIISEQFALSVGGGLFSDKFRNLNVSKSGPDTHKIKSDGTYLRLASSIYFAPVRGTGLLQHLGMSVKFVTSNFASESLLDGSTQKATLAYAVQSVYYGVEYRRKLRRTLTEEERRSVVRNDKDIRVLGFNFVLGVNNGNQLTKDTKEEFAFTASFQSALYAKFGVFYGFS